VGARGKTNEGKIHMNKSKIALSYLARKEIARSFCQYIYDYHCKEFWSLVEKQDWEIEDALDIFIEFSEDSRCSFFETLYEDSKAEIIHLLKYEFADDEYIEHWRCYPKYRERPDE